MKMFRPIPVIAGLISALSLFAAEPRPPVTTLALADRVLTRGLAVSDLGTYPGTLLLQGMSELARVSEDRSLLGRTVALYQKFPTKEIKGRGSFISYEVGGSGAALLRYHGLADPLAPQVTEAAQRMVTKQKRSGEGLLMPPWVVAEKDQIFIDPAFAVTPFLLYAGLAEQRSDYVDLAVFETLELFRILRDHETGLLHQGRGFQGRGVISQDNWSRGNGWGAMALAALIRDLPATHPRRKEVEQLATDFFAKVLRYQNKDGLWHQEMTDPASYVEISGSGLLLYSLGIMIEKGVLDKSHAADVARGVAGLTAYVAEDGSVSHTCIGCLCPGQGTKEDYKSRLWAYNDPHAFGAVVLACAQAAKLGIREVTPTLPPGCYADPTDSPTPPKAYLRRDPDKGQNVAWENDRIAFRIYGPSVRNRVGSGFDVWTKSVEFPVIDKWYRLTAAGFEYHIDRGEGCDFYEVGRRRGCGGTAVWIDGRPYPSQTYETYRAVRNEPDGIEFQVAYEPWDAGGKKVSEQKTIRMIPGTNFFQVTSMISAPSAAPVTVGIGLSTFGQAKVATDEKRAALSSWEKTSDTHGTVGTAIVVNPAQFAGFAESAGDRYILITVTPGEPFSYYVGAGWDGNYRFKTAAAWEKMIREEASWTTLNNVYARKPAPAQLGKKL